MLSLFCHAISTNILLIKELNPSHHILQQTDPKTAFSNTNNIVFLFCCLKIFECLRQQDPNVFKKVIPIVGELTLEDLGLTEIEKEKLINEVSIVFHFAATLKLESNVKDAILQNTIGTKTLLDLCVKMKKLASFVHLSTAFCHCDVEVLEEKMYPSLKDPYEVMELVKTTDYKTMEKMEQRYV